MSAFVDSEVDIPQGKRLSYCTTANGTFTVISGTTDVTPPERERGEAEYTSDDSAGRTKQFKPAMSDPGKCKGKYRYQKTQFAAIETLSAAATQLYFKLQTPDLAVHAWQGFFTKHNVGELGMEEVPDVDFEIRVNGVTTFTAAPSGS